MSDIYEYKCTQCGGRMEFNIEEQNMQCPYCGKSISIEEYQSTSLDSTVKEDDNVDWSPMEDNSWHAGETDNMKVYLCQSCGGQIIADDTTGASSCPYCDNRILVKEQFSGDLKPDYIIPFKLDKKQAKKAYLNHLKGKIFLPRVFRRENHIDEIKGLYVPFWLYDIDVDADFVFNAERQTIYVRGDTEYTDHEYYVASRSGSISFDHIPEDGSEKMDDTLMESVEPYDFQDAVPFSSAYLSGYMADRYDVSMEERIERARQRVVNSTRDSFKETVNGYQVVTEGSSSINITRAEYLYALYPVWILNTTWKKNKYVFAMNGQTGKLVGDLPMDKSLFAKYIAIRGPILGAAIYGIMYLVNML